MVRETIKLYTNALRHPTYGVNAQLLALPLEDGASRPDPFQLITNELENGTVARRYVNVDEPNISVALAQPADLDPAVITTVRDAEITLAVNITLANTDTEVGHDNTYTVMRAIERATAAFLKPANAADHQLNAIEVYQCTRMTHEVTDAYEESTPLVGVLTLSFKVRDTLP